MMRLRMRGSWWDGPVLHFDARDEDDAPVAEPLLEPGTEFHWQVAQHQTERAVPAWVFEPKRPTEGMDLRGAPPEAQTWDPLCDEAHSVYIAFFGTLPKVGLTLAARLEARLREQGADAGFSVATVADREKARALEKTLSRAYDLPEWRRAKDTLPRLARPLDRAVIEDRVAAWRRRLDGFDTQPLVWVEPVPLERPLPGRPGWINAPGSHAGRWLGALGNHLFYEAEVGPLDVGTRPVRALRRQDLEGRWIDIA